MLLIAAVKGTRERPSCKQIPGLDLPLHLATRYTTTNEICEHTQDVAYVLHVPDVVGSESGMLSTAAWHKLQQLPAPVCITAAPPAFAAQTPVNFVLHKIKCKKDLASFADGFRDTIVHQTVCLKVHAQPLAVHICCLFGLHNITAISHKDLDHLGCLVPGGHAIY